MDGEENEQMGVAEDSICFDATTWFQYLKEWTKLDIDGASQLATDRERWRKIINVTVAQIAPPD